MVCEKATIKFDTDVSTVENAIKNLTLDAKNAMQIFAVTLLLNPELGLNVTGYADAQGTKDSKGTLLTGDALTLAQKNNQMFSENRAKALKEYVGQYLAEQKCTPEEIKGVMDRIYTQGNGTRTSENDAIDRTNSENRVAEGTLTASDGTTLTQCQVSEILNKMGAKFEECPKKEGKK